MTIIAYVFLLVENCDFKRQKGTNNMFNILYGIIYKKICI